MLGRTMQGMHCPKSCAALLITSLSLHFRKGFKSVSITPARKNKNRWRISKIRSEQQLGGRMRYSQMCCWTLGPCRECRSQTVKFLCSCLNMLLTGRVGQCHCAAVSGSGTAINSRASAIRPQFSTCLTLSTCLNTSLFKALYKHVLRALAELGASCCASGFHRNLN